MPLMVASSDMHDCNILVIFTKFYGFKPRMKRAIYMYVKQSDFANNSNINITAAYYHAYSTSAAVVSTAQHIYETQ